MRRLSVSGLLQWNRAAGLPVAEGTLQEDSLHSSILTSGRPRQETLGDDGLLARKCGGEGEGLVEDQGDERREERKKKGGEKRR